MNQIDLPCTESQSNSVEQNQRQVVLNIMPSEKWNWVVGYENLYSISNFGVIFSYHRRAYLKQQECNGYLRVSLCKDGKVSAFFVHRLVALAFIVNDNQDVATIVNHKDGNRKK